MLDRNEITFDAALADLRERKAEVRVRAAVALGTCDDQDRAEGCAALRAALRDSAGQVRAAAAAALGELGDAQAIGVLLTQVSDGDPQAREAAVMALGEIAAAGADARQAWDQLCAALAEG